MPEKLSEDMQQAADFIKSGSDEKGCARLTPGVLVAIGVLIVLMFIGAAFIYSLVFDSDGDLAELTPAEQRCIDFANDGYDLHILPDCPGLIASLAFPSEEQCHLWVDRAGMTPAELPNCAQYLQTQAPATPAATPPPTAAPTPGANSSRIAPATNVTATTDQAGFILVEWDYLEALEVVPDHFDTYFGDQLVDTYGYQGLTGDYSFIEEVPCGATYEIVVVAINGADTARTEPIQGATPPC